MSTVQGIADAIASWKYDLSDEIRTQDQIGGALKAANIPFDREVKLTDSDRIDFMCGTVGLEVKLKGQARAIFRQIQRYSASPRVTQIIVVTARTLGMPKSVGGKPVHVLALGRTML